VFFVVPPVSREGPDCPDLEVAFMPRARMGGPFYVSFVTLLTLLKFIIALLVQEVKR
jgi:hypothetical protein